MTVIVTVAYIAVVLLFGFLINTITVADAVTTTIAASTATIPTNTTTTTTTTDFNTIRGNTTGLVTHIVDGDTLDLDINNGTITRIRFSLVNTPERGEPGYKEAKDFVAATCPVGSTAIFDADNGQKLSFGRVVGVIYCVGGSSSSGSSGSNTNYSNNILINLNQALLQNKYAEPVTRFCDISEFSERNWIKDQCGSSSISKQAGK